jgi:hypothetical protein
MDTERVCPWTDEEKLAEIEEKIAEKAGRSWWKGFPWRLVSGMLTVSGLLAVYIWTGVVTRVDRVERTVHDHMIVTATTTAQYDALAKQMGEMRAEVQALHVAFSAKNDMVDENNKMLKRLVARTKD